MINWYYVQGSERLGPVSEQSLKELFLKGEITNESYVWKKGFQNWEKIKDVQELNFSKPSLKVPTPIPVAKVKPTSLEMNLHFDWDSIHDDEEVFFIKTGSDRHSEKEAAFYGPYSKNELHEAFLEKRINRHSHVYSAGMPGWIEVGDTPLDLKNPIVNLTRVREGAPLMIVAELGSLPVIALVSKVDSKQCSFLSSGPLKAGNTLLCSIYCGSALKAKDVKINIEEYDSRTQLAAGKIVEINESAQRVILDHA